MSNGAVENWFRRPSATAADRVQTCSCSCPAPRQASGPSALPQGSSGCGLSRDLALVPAVGVYCPRKVARVVLFSSPWDFQVTGGHVRQLAPLAFGPQQDAAGALVWRISRTGKNGRPDRPGLCRTSDTAGPHPGSSNSTYRRRSSPLTLRIPFTVKASAIPPMTRTARFFLAGRPRTSVSRTSHRSVTTRRTGGTWVRPAPLQRTLNGTTSARYPPT